MACAAEHHVLCLDNAQTFSFCPRPDCGDVVVVRKAVSPGGGMRLTGAFPMPLQEARELWRSLRRDGAFLVRA